MKINVRVHDEVFEVEVGDLHTRPVIATIEGQRFELWPEAEAQEAAPDAPPAPVQEPRRAEIRPTASPAAPPSNPPAQNEASAAGAIRAPIPGVILSVSIQPDTEVTRGQELCVLEAMKMNNTIRAPRPGRIRAVRVAIGQHIKHGEVLMEYDV